MRGTTAKRLRKFAQYLIDNTPADQRANKDRHQMTNELKVHWRTKGKRGQEFIRQCLSGDFVTE